MNNIDDTTTLSTALGLSMAEYALLSLDRICTLPDTSDEVRKLCKETLYAAEQLGYLGRMRAEGILTTNFGEKAMNKVTPVLKVKTTDNTGETTATIPLTIVESLALSLDRVLRALDGIEAGELTTEEAVSDIYNEATNTLNEAFNHGYLNRLVEHEAFAGYSTPGRS